VIFYKQIIRQFLKYFGQKYFKIRQFRESFAVEKDFHILIKEWQVLELELKGRNNSLSIRSKPYALQLYPNALQAKLQSRGWDNHQIKDC